MDVAVRDLMKGDRFRISGGEYEVTKVVHYLGVMEDYAIVGCKFLKTGRTSSASFPLDRILNVTNRLETGLLDGLIPSHIEERKEQ